MAVAVEGPVPAGRVLVRELEVAARGFAALTAAGAVAGVVVGGIGGRLAMLVLARLTPAATGRLSDDGFVMGRFTVGGTLNLLLVGAALGVVGALFYALVRGLALGPRWFRLLSLAGGPAIVVGELLVHTGGVDFRLLRPAALAIAMFVAIPGLYVLLLVVLGDRWTRPGAWSATAPWPLALAPLLVWVPIAVGGLVVAVAWVVRRSVRRFPRVDAVVSHAAVAWLLRGALTVVFVRAALELAREVAVLT